MLNSNIFISLFLGILLIAASGMVLFQALSRRFGKFMKSERLSSKQQYKRLEHSLRGNRQKVEKLHSIVNQTIHEWSPRIEELNGKADEWRPQVEVLNEKVNECSRLVRDLDEKLNLLPQRFSAALPPAPPIIPQTSSSLLHMEDRLEIHAVLSFPKTGSLTLYSTLQNIFSKQLFPLPENFHPGHFHAFRGPAGAMKKFFDRVIAMTPDTPWSDNDDFQVRAWNEAVFSVGHTYRHTLSVRGVLPLDPDRLNKGTPRDTANPVVNFLVAVRDPVANMVSLLFQYISLWKRWEDLSDEAFLDILRNPPDMAMVPCVEDCPWPLLQERWWKDQMQAIFGIDFFSLDFERERGWSIYDFGEVRFLVVQVESYDQLPEALSEFYDLPSRYVHVTNANVGSEKGHHGTRYQQFLPRVKLPEQVLDLAYDSPFTRHFYTEAQITNLKQRWGQSS